MGVEEDVGRIQKWVGGTKNLLADQKNDGLLMMQPKFYEVPAVDAFHTTGVLTNHRVERLRKRMVFRR